VSRVSRSNGLPEPLSATLASAAQDWFASPDRPRPQADVVRHWDSLVEAWVSHRSMPLLVRKSGDRGVERRYPSGRAIVCVDNSPAHWTLACAIAGDRPTVEDLHSALTSGEWPVMFAMSKAEVAQLPRYRGLLSRSERARALNDGQWKVCHIDEVGLRGRGSVETFPLSTLVEHCRRLLAPSNMFLVPNSHAGFGELPEVVKAFRRARQA